MKMIVFLWFAFGQSGIQAGLARTTLNAYTQGGKSLQTGINSPPSPTHILLDRSMWGFMFYHYEKVFYSNV